MTGFAGVGALAAPANGAAEHAVHLLAEHGALPPFLAPLERAARGWLGAYPAGATCLLILAALLGLLAAVWLARRWRRNEHPYVAAAGLLTPAERAFFGALEDAIGDDWRLFAKVRLADLLLLERGVAGKQRLQAFGRISSKHADFVVCEPGSFRVLGVIELDDRSHRRPDRQKRDEFFDRAFAAASIPVWRVPARRAYDRAALRREAQAIFGGG